MPQFHETGYGRRFFEHELPELNRSLKRIADALEKNSEPKSSPSSKIDDDYLKIPGLVDRLIEANIIPDVSLKPINNIDLLKSLKIPDFFSIRITNCLLESRRGEKTNLYQLITSKESELMHIKNFGVKCLWEVKNFLASYNLELDMNDEEILRVNLSDMHNAVKVCNNLMQSSRVVNGLPPQFRCG